MKTLADLKRDAQNYEWSMIHNSWFTNTNNLKSFRKVACKNNVGLGFETIRSNGEKAISYLDWPKAKELHITKIDNESYHVMIASLCRDKEHVILYELKLIKEKYPELIE